MDFKQIYSRFMDLAKIGQAEDGSVTRLLFSQEYLEAAAGTKEYMEQAGLKVRTDSCKNVHGIYNCGEPGAKTVYLGSHLDTVRQGGLYDGTGRSGCSRLHGKSRVLWLDTGRS